MADKKQNEKTFPLQYFKGIGPKRAEAFEKAGISNPIDLLFYFPRDYVDRANVSSLKALEVKLRQELFTTSELLSGQELSFKKEISIVARIKEMIKHSFGKNRKLLKMLIEDSYNGRAYINFWSYTDYYEKIYKSGELIIVSGTPELDDYGKINFNHPEIEKFESEDEEKLNSGRILPVYRLSQNLKNSHINTRVIRTIISNLLETEIQNIEENLPDYILKKFNLPALQKAIQNLHFPENSELISFSKNRLKYEEILYFELFVLLRQKGLKTIETGITFNPKSSKARKLYESLPFTLTDSQKKVIREISSDLSSGKPMNRLLQGDVGSGKTIVALLTMLTAVDNGCQAAFMAPTEILAEQHFHTLTNFLEGFDVNVVQLVGGQKTRMRNNILDQIRSGEANIIVGTHALFESEIGYNNLGLIIIDEQHRFGVLQRAELKRLGQNSLNNQNITPHILVMTATPIPRTLSLTLYGDLDVSIIREMPKNRKPIISKVVFESELQSCYDFIRKEIKKGHQAFIVYPLVDESEKLELKAATVHYEKLSKEIFPDLKCGLLHGQMFWYEKEETMKAFLNKEYDILVATTVIEVGIDIPNATIMLIENSERFGLSQLHQLRGRVGRGPEQSYCLLATKDNYKFQIRKKINDELEQKTAVIRLKTMEETNDGFKIAEIDLKLRGPGDIMGTKQSGLPAFKFIDLANDGDIITEARKLIEQILEKDTHLRLPENQILRKEFLRRFESGKIYFDVA